MRVNIYFEAVAIARKITAFTRECLNLLIGQIKMARNI